MHIVAVCYIGL